MNRAAHLLVLLPTLLACGPVRAVECADFLRMHGMLRRAQAQCAFDSFNPEIVDTAHQCFDKIGPDEGAPAMRAGAAVFDRMVDLCGRNGACALIGRRFPMVVR